MRKRQGPASTFDPTTTQPSGSLLRQTRREPQPRRWSHCDSGQRGHSRAVPYAALAAFPSASMRWTRTAVATAERRASKIEVRDLRSQILDLRVNRSTRAILRYCVQPIHPAPSKESNMTDHTTIATRYIDLWNER